jgi:hypothetical protein
MKLAIESFAELRMIGYESRYGSTPLCDVLVVVNVE